MMRDRLLLDGCSSFRFNSYLQILTDVYPVPANSPAIKSMRDNQVFSKKCFDFILKTKPKFA